MGGIVVGIVVTPFVELVKARMTTEQARDAATAVDKRETSQSDRDLIKQAL